MTESHLGPGDALQSLIKDPSGFIHFSFRHLQIHNKNLILYKQTTKFSQVSVNEGDFVEKAH